MAATCKHKLIECPNHEGGFDCASFCELCEGFQEYCQEGCPNGSKCPTSEPGCTGECYGFECIYCSVNTMHNNEYYMLKDDIWALVTATAGTKGKGMACIGCVEEQLGRRVTRDDFNLRVPLNSFYTWQSERLQDRLESNPDPYIIKLG